MTVNAVGTPRAVGIFPSRAANAVSSAPVAAPTRPPVAPSPTGGSGGPLTYGAAYQIPATGNDVDTLRRYLVGIMQESVGQDLAGQNQLQNLVVGVNSLQVGQLESLRGLINAGTTRLEQFFILKAYAANEPWANLQQYATEMRGQPEATILSRSTMRDSQDIIQQWQDACGPAVIQTAAGEVDPRYAWELNKIADLARIDPLGANKFLAQQQKEWLEKYGGQAVLRGQKGGTPIAIDQMLNDMLSPISGASYAVIAAPDTSMALSRVASKLAAGFDVPLRVSWDPASVPAGRESGHFILAMSVRGQGAGRQFQIHDPWTGQTAWVPERNIMAGNMSPIFGQPTRLTHYYDPTPRR